MPKKELRGREGLPFCQGVVELREHFGSIAALARRTGIGHSSLRSILLGHAPSVETCRRIAQKTGCSLTWLVTGEGEMFGGDPGFAAIQTFITGGGDHWAVSDQYQPYETHMPRGLIGFEVRGDSMEPLARNGQIVLALPAAEPGDGDLAVVEFHDETHTFKRVYFRGETVVLVSVNPTYDPELRSRPLIRRMMKVWGVKF